MAAAEGNLGSILAVFIDPAALGAESNQVPVDPNAVSTFKNPIIGSVSGDIISVTPKAGNVCPSGFLYDAASKTCVNQVVRVQRGGP